MKVYSLLVPTEEKNWATSVLEALAYGALNYGLFFWPLSQALEADLLDKAPAVFAGLAALSFVIAPIVWPILLRWLLTQRCLRGRIVHPTPKAWDSRFGGARPCWILVHLKDGALVGGKYATRSFVSSYPRPEDLYLEEVWRVDAEGKFREAIPQSEGLWVPGRSVQFLEFFEMGEEGKPGGKAPETPRAVRL